MESHAGATVLSLFIQGLLVFLTRTRPGGGTLDSMLPAGEDVAQDTPGTPSESAKETAMFKTYSMYSPASGLMRSFTTLVKV